MLYIYLFTDKHQIQAFLRVVLGGVCVLAREVNTKEQLAYGELTVPAVVCRWELCPRCLSVGRCLSGVNISSSSS